MVISLTCLRYSHPYNSTLLLPTNPPPSTAPQIHANWILFILCLLSTHINNARSQGKRKLLPFNYMDLKMQSAGIYTSRLSLYMDNIVRPTHGSNYMKLPLVRFTYAPLHIVCSSRLPLLARSTSMELILMKLQLRSCNQVYLFRFEATDVTKQLQPTQWKNRFGILLFFNQSC
jgi:hypothetical protein